MFTDSLSKRNLQTFYFGGGLCPFLLVLRVQLCSSVTNLHAYKGAPSVIISMSGYNQCHLLMNGAADLAFGLTYYDYGL
jgi:hypothetical protein